MSGIDNVMPLATSIELQNAGDEAQVDRRKRAVKIQEQKRANDLKAVMDTPQGRAVLWRVLAYCGVFQSSFVAGQSDTTAFKEGQRNVGLKLLAQLQEHCPEQYRKAETEARQEDKG